VEVETNITAIGAAVVAFAAAVAAPVRENACGCVVTFVDDDAVVLAVVIAAVACKRLRFHRGPLIRAGDALLPSKMLFNCEVPTLLCVRTDHATIWGATNGS
jgi:hypothetical protein